MIEVFKAGSKEMLEKVYAIRHEVFVVEQNCPPELEWEHEEESKHFLATVNTQPAGAARWRATEKGFKLERFAVSKPFRGKGVGQHLIQAILQDLPSTSDYIYLHAQVQAYNLYRKFGFEEEGSQFEEAGIVHYKMVLKH